MKRSSAFTIFTSLLLLICIPASLLMMSDALKDSSQFSRFYRDLFIFTVIALCSLVTLILLKLKTLVYEYRKRVPGTQMTIKMICMFTALSVTPVLIVYFFSLNFLHQGIDSWFDLRTEEALDNSLQLSKLSLGGRMKELLKQTEQIAEEIAELPDADIPSRINILRERINAKEITLFDRKGTIITSSAQDAASIIPDRPSETTLLQLQQGGSYTAIDNAIKTGLHIRVVLNVPNISLGDGSRIMQALYPLSEKTNKLTNSIQTSYIKYRELSYLREKLKLSLILILTLVLLFSILAAIWTAFYFSRRHVGPLRDMVEGTKAIAEGDYHTHIVATKNDELGFLVSSFNEMARKIAQARDLASHSQKEVEAQQTYLEAVLGRLSSGVLVFDQNSVLRTANVSAGNILGVPPGALREGETLTNIYTQYHHLAPMWDTILSHTDTVADWREQIIFFGGSGRQVLICSGTPHFLTKGEDTGYVIVFDDITKLIQAQKNAVWSEMARRLAHEIKNPLTPIQLATERLRQKYLINMDQQDADILNRLTNTIIQQVATIKEMTDTFSEYARTSEIKQREIDINALIKEVVDLFTGLDQRAELILELEPDLPKINADISKLRQVLNNVLKNAFDACENTHPLVLRIASKRISTAGKEHIEISISDSGTGIDKDIIDQIFEPYVTTKTKGTGLGLAIVKKIVEEHNGVVSLENNPDGIGTKTMIRLPTIQRQNTIKQANSMTGGRA